MTKFKTLSRTSLLKKTACKIEPVDFGNGEGVYVREMSGQGKNIYERSIMKKVNRNGQEVYETTLDNFKAKLCVATVCDEKGELLLTPEDMLKFSNAISAKKMEMIVEVAQRLNALDAKEQEDILKN